jgi:hypothetical protein
MSPREPTTPQTAGENPTDNLPNDTTIPENIGDPDSTPDSVLGTLL